MSPRRYRNLRHQPEFTERCNAGVFYQFRTKHSDNNAFDYSNNQLGVYANYKY